LGGAEAPPCQGREEFWRAPIAPRQHFSKFFDSRLENMEAKDEIPLVNLKIVIEPGEVAVAVWLA
jgi:hypothetical protein